MKNTVTSNSNLTESQQKRRDELLADKDLPFRISPEDEAELAELEALANGTTEPDLPERIMQRRINLASPPPDNVFLLKRDDVGCFPVGDLVGGGGKAKQGKTNVEAVFTVALLKGEFMGFTATRRNIRVLYLDCEQNPVNTAKYAQKVHRLCDWNPEVNHPRFFALNLRGDSPEERVKIIEEAVQAIAPDVVFADGVKDLLKDINDTTQSSDVLSLLMRLTKEHPICLYCVLHENKNDTNLRGHIGTELLNKASEIWRVKKVGDIFEVEQSESRNRPCDGFSFRIDRESGLMEEVDAPPRESAAQKSDRKLRENIRVALPPFTTLTYSDLRETYSEVAGIAEKTAEKHIGDAIKRNYIQKIDSGSYHLTLPSTGD